MIRDITFVGTDADDMTIFGVECPDVEGILTTKDHIVVEFVSLLLKSALCNAEQLIVIQRHWDLLSRH